MLVRWGGLAVCVGAAGVFGHQDQPLGATSQSSCDRPRRCAPRRGDCRSRGSTSLRGVPGSSTLPGWLRPAMPRDAVRK